MKKIKAGPYLAAYKKQQRRMIPCDIIMTVIALFAAVIMFVSPLLKVNISVHMEALSPYLQEFVDDALEEALNESGATKEYEYTQYSVMIDDVLKEIGDVELTIAIMPSDLMSLMNADKDKLISVIAGLIPDSGNIAEYINRAANAAVPALLSVFVTMAVESLAGEASGATADVISGYYEDIKVVMDALAEGDDKAARAQYSDVVSAILDQYTSDVLTDAQKAAYMGQFDGMFDAVTEYAEDENGNFSYVALLGNIGAIVEYMEENLKAVDEMGDTSGYAMASAPLEEENDYEEDDEYFDDDYFDDDDYEEDEGEFSLQAVLDILDNPEEFISELLGDLDDDTIASLSFVFLIACALFIFLPMALWAILAILAFSHIFRKNRAVGMWYVKLICPWTCIIFFLLPTLAVAFLPQILSFMAIEEEMASLVTNILGLSFGGAGFYAGICYILTWLVSIFGFYPHKRKIRKMYKDEKRVTKRA